MKSLQHLPNTALGAVVGSVDALTSGRALYALLTAFAVAGLLMSLAFTTAASPGALGMAIAVLAFGAAFYGGNTAGLLLWDQACGHALRDVPTAMRDAVACSARLFAVLLLVLAALGVLIGAVAALLWLARSDVLGSQAGPLLFGLIVPVGAVVAGVALAATASVVAPLAAPAVWCGLGVAATLELVTDELRQRPLLAFVLVAAVTLLASLVGGLGAAVVAAGGRILAVLAVLVTGVDIPPQQLLAGLFGTGVRGVVARNVATGPSSYAAAAVTGGGMVFALLLVLPVLVYLRGLCAVLLLLRPALRAFPGAPRD